MKKYEMIVGINRILENNNIPWKLAEPQEHLDYPDYLNHPDFPNYPEGKIQGNTPGLFGDGIVKRIFSKGGSDINLFPSDVTGDLHDDFLGICGLGSGNKSLRDTFSAMADWAQAHADMKSPQKLTAVIMTDKWNAAQYEEQCAPFKYLNIHLVVILCMGKVPVQLPYVYSDKAIEKFIELHAPLNDEQTEAIKHVVRIIRSGHRVDNLGNLNGIDNDVVYWMLMNAFGHTHAFNEVLKDLNKAL